MLPGGADNLNNPDYDLADEASRAPRDGTLMRVRSLKRLPNNNLAIVVQGLARIRVERGLRATPYARADVRVVPDAEARIAAGGLAEALVEDEA